MRKELLQSIEIPEGVEVLVDKNTILVKGKEGENKRIFNFSGLDIKKEGKILSLGHKKATKNEKRRINTTIAHIKNMINGVQKKFQYKLKICFSHFPFTVEVKGNEALIKNFLGEKIPRKLKIMTGAEINVDKDIITVTAIDRELAGQVAADFERVTKIRKRDRRVFQDGIYITNKAGRDI